ncbi:hypothetical protein [Haladaptatus sp. W1]|uniref:hypothetical protein n=1 Tax=Haladaptatus sp. W1 TaxID=1897478 RepID=UPI001C2F365E|nr:hypothetical protein [Haladaptatus sp. W1]
MWGDDIPIGKRTFRLVLEDTQTNLTILGRFEFEEMFGLCLDVFLRQLVPIRFEDGSRPVEDFIINLIQSRLTLQPWNE